MKVSYLLSGMLDPSTVIEVAGSVYFSNNYHVKHYIIDTVRIEEGRLCIYFTTDNLPPNLAKPKQHYLKIEPNLDVVELYIKEYEPCSSGKTHVTFYSVRSMNVPARGDYFRYRKYEADLEYPFSDNLSCNVSDDFLVKSGFTCTDEIDDDGNLSFTVYRRK